MECSVLAAGGADFWLWAGAGIVLAVGAAAVAAVAWRQRLRRAVAGAGYALRPEKTWRRLLMELSSDAMLLVGRSGRVLEVNQNACDLCGWTQKDLLEQPVTSIVGEQDRAAAREALQRLPSARTLTGRLLLQTKNRELVRTEWRWVPASRGEFYVFIRDLRAPARFDEWSAPAEEVAVLNRISAAVSQLFDLQRVLEHAIEESVKVVGCDVGAITLVDQATGRLTVATTHGLPADRLRQAVESVTLESNPLSQEIFKTRSIQYHKSLNRAPLLPSVLELFQEEDVHSLLSIPIASKGKVLGQLDLGVRRPHAFHAVNSAVLSAIGEQIGMAIQNARLVQEVSEKAVHLQHVLDSSPAGILVVSYLPHDATVTLVSSRLGEIFGHPASALLNRSLAQLRGLLQGCFDDPQVFEQHFARWMTERDTEERCELALDRPKPLVLDHFTGPVYDDFKQVVGRIWVLRDITEQKAMADSLRQAQKLESVGTLAAGIAHDFRNLLGNIMGNLSLMRENLADGQALARFLTNAESAAQSAAEMCKSLLAFGRKAPARLVPLRLDDTIKQAVGLLKGSLPSQVHLLTDVASDLRPVEADATQIIQMIMNLSINSCDAMPKGGRLVIRAANRDLDQAACAGHAEARPGAFVMLEIEDTGEGMSPALLSRIFEPFFTTKPAGKGTGLGLSMVYGITKAHSGWVQVRSQVGVGTAFQIFLPITNKPPTDAVVTAGAVNVPTITLPPPTAPTTMNNVPSSKPSSAAPETILVADDDRMLLELTQTFLQKAGYEVLVAASGQEALELFRSNLDRVALAILDLHMPAMSGEECLCEMRKIRPALKALFLTGYDAETAGEAVARSGAVGSLCKPIQRAAFIEAVRQALAASPPSA